MTTPLLVPSFSSKGFPEVQKIINTSEEFITESALISAYDIYHSQIKKDVAFPEILFVDSGGYEASKDTEFTDLGYSDYEPGEWSRDKHIETLEQFKLDIPVVFISYDHPKEKCSYSDQVNNAHTLFNSRECIKEILIKPETDRIYLDVDKLINEIDLFLDFDIIGLTEKELGNSILLRMENIGRIREAINKNGKETPIHIFGSLDTISTPLYFLSGADIFDGLTWLRFAYHEGQCIYIHNYTAINTGINTKDTLGIAKVWFNNYYYLQQLELEMKKYLKQSDFSCFNYHSELFKQSSESLQAKLEEY